VLTFPRGDRDTTAEVVNTDMQKRVWQEFEYLVIVVRVLGVVWGEAIQNQFILCGTLCLYFIICSTIH